MSILDIHTHRAAPAPQSIIDIDPAVCRRPELLPSGQYYSVGIHPWNTAVADARSLEMLSLLASDRRVVAIGECGLDALRGAPLAGQLPLFLLQARLADDCAKPLIIHAVKTLRQIVGHKLRLRPRVPWIIHGFRGKPQMARQLLDHGFYISLGEHFNPDSRAIIPAGRLLAETDTSPLAPDQIAARLRLAAPLPLFGD